MSGDGARRLVLVVGVGRSGTSLLTGILGQLGVHIPQPEVQADDTNPRGFGEPRWAVDFHRRLLRSRRAVVNDARPSVWESTYGAAEDPEVRAELRDWLTSQFGEADAVVVKDPRTVWFLPLWMRCAEELGAQASCVTMLRHPAEILASARKSYGEDLTMATRAAAWLNVMLETERATRDAPRAFVRYEDLLDDWKREVTRVGGLLDIPLLAAPQPDRAQAADSFVDPTLHRNRVRWDELDVPASVERLAESVWVALQPLAEPGDAAAAQSALDPARSDYLTLYAEAEAIAQSSVNAAKRRGGGSGGKAGGPGAPSLRVRIARRVPARHRRRLRRMLGALRRQG
jgi:hypothetical protein